MSRIGPPPKGTGKCIALRVLKHPKMVRTGIGRMETFYEPCPNNAEPGSWHCAEHNRINRLHKLGIHEEEP